MAVVSVRHLALVFVYLGLSACSTFGGRPHDDREAAAKWEQRSARIERIQGWALSGRAVVKDGRKSWHFGLYWKNTATGYSLELKTPLGQGVARLRTGVAGAELQIPDEPTLRADDAGALLNRRFGWRIPTSLMTRWVLGLPTQRQRMPVLDDSGVAREIREAGWDIRYRRYADWSGYRLPEMIIMSQGGTEVRVVIDEWVIDG